jgi:hypothetical protein
MNFVKQIFTDETVNLDDNSFDECTFVRCALVYKGGPFRLVGNTLNSPRFVLDGPALNTLRFMSELYRGGAKDIIELTFDSIRGGGNPADIWGDTVH